MFNRLLGRTPPVAPAPSPDPAADSIAAAITLADVDKQVKRMAKESYKTQTLLEAQMEQTRQVIDLFKASLGELQAAQKSDDDVVQQRIQRARVDVAKAILPVIDSVEAGLRSGAAILATLPPDQIAALEALHGWLNGQRLLLERLDTILETEGIERLVTVGQPFDPHYHVAVKSAYEAGQTVGMILEEARRGYRRGDEVIRYADVIVNRAPDPMLDRTPGDVL